MDLDITVDIHTDKDAAVDTAVSVDMDADVLRWKPRQRQR